jgi:hypothetical protein
MRKARWRPSLVASAAARLFSARARSPASVVVGTGSRTSRSPAESRVAAAAAARMGRDIRRASRNPAMRPARSPASEASASRLITCQASVATCACSSTMPSPSPEGRPSTAVSRPLCMIVSLTGSPDAIFATRSAGSVFGFATPSRTSTESTPCPRRVRATLAARCSSRAGFTAAKFSITSAATCALSASAPRASARAVRTARGNDTIEVIRTETAATRQVTSTVRPVSPRHHARAEAAWRRLTRSPHPPCSRPRGPCG